MSVGAAVTDLQGRAVIRGCPHRTLKTTASPGRTITATRSALRESLQPQEPDLKYPGCASTMSQLLSGQQQ